MTKNTDTATETPTFEFVDIAEATANKYAPLVEALNAAGEGKGYTLVTETAVHEKELRLIRDAANDIDRSARKVKPGTVEKDGVSTTTIRLTDRIIRGAGEGDDSPESEDAPEVSE